jgi:hypothetical protein
MEERTAVQKEPIEEVFSAYLHRGETLTKNKGEV